jgi:hypothetical protein
MAWTISFLTESRSKTGCFRAQKKYEEALEDIGGRIEYEALMSRP